MVLLFLCEVTVERRNYSYVLVALSIYLDHQYLFLVKNSSVFLSVVQRSQSQ